MRRFDCGPGPKQVKARRDPASERIAEILLPPRCVTLWIGPRLGPVERACLKSVLNQGHPLALYCYDKPAGVPDGVELRDASAILPKDRIIRHETGSFALFSNWFRYELQRRGAGTWVDCDVYLLAPLDGASPCLFGEEEAGRINTGVLRLPPDSPLLPPLIALFEERSVPPWLPLRSRLAARLRLWRHGRSGLASMPWGSAGPKALTYLVRRHGMGRHALPSDTFCPAPWQDALWIVDPARTLGDFVTQRTVAVHLWNERIKQVKDVPAPPGSFLARLQAEGRP
jgi:hypothetical protein